MASDGQFELDLPFTSPFKETPLFLKDGKAFFGIWKPPAIQIDGDEKRIKVDLAHEGDLTKYAEEEYGDPSLFWVIGHVNKINYPPRDVVNGLVIIIPKEEHVMAALQAAQERKQNV